MNDERPPRQSREQISYSYPVFICRYKNVLYTQQRKVEDTIVKEIIFSPNR